MGKDESPESNHGRTSQELFLASFLDDYDDDAPWDAVKELRRQNTPEVLKLAVNYAHSSVSRERARAIDVLAQLGAGQPAAERPFLDESVAIAGTLLLDSDPVVAHSAACALSHLRSDRAISALIRVRNHPDPGVRQAVAAGVVGTSRDDSIETLIGLMEDADDRVRVWATFGLGTQCSEDSAEIREALHKRLTDTFEEARNEAIWGLARRKDRTGLQLLLDRLETDHWSGDDTTATDILGLKTGTPIEHLRVGLRSLLRSG